MTLIYLYAVAPAAAGRWLVTNDLRGIGGARVRAIATGGVLGAVSDVPAAEFDQEPLDRNVADADWLAPNAAAHQDVNAALLDAAGAVLPLAFGTIFRSEERIRDALGVRERELVAGLVAVTGRVEWVVTLDRDRRAALAHLERTRDPAKTAAAGEGRAYLLRRKVEVESTDELRALDREARAELQQALADVAEELTDEPLIEGGPAARLTALARRDRAGALGQAVEDYAGRWRERGYEPRLAGPWPPYRYSARVGSLRGA